MVTDNRGTLGDAAPVEYSAWIHRLDRLLQPERTTVYPLLILILWPLAWMFTMLIGSQPMMVDFVARWTGGRMLTAGGGDHLYDPLAQIAYQVDLFGQEGALSWFVGPPFEAVLLTPLGLLPYPAGVLLWTIASMAALVISLRLLGGEARPPAL